MWTYGSAHGEDHLQRQSDAKRLGLRSLPQAAREAVLSGLQFLEQNPEVASAKPIGARDTNRRRRCHHTPWR